MTKQIDELDGLRGWMALWVWVTHVTTVGCAAVRKDERRWLAACVISMTLASTSDQPKQ